MKTERKNWEKKRGDLFSLLLSFFRFLVCVSVRMHVIWGRQWHRGILEIRSCVLWFESDGWKSATAPHIPIVHPAPYVFRPRSSPSRPYPRRCPRPKFPTRGGGCSFLAGPFCGPRGGPPASRQPLELNHGVRSRSIDRWHDPSIDRPPPPSIHESIVHLSVPDRLETSNEEVGWAPSRAPLAIDRSVARGLLLRWERSKQESRSLLCFLPLTLPSRRLSRPPPRRLRRPPCPRPISGPAKALRCPITGPIPKPTPKTPFTNLSLSLIPPCVGPPTLPRPASGAILQLKHQRVPPQPTFSLASLVLPDRSVASLAYVAKSPPPPHVFRCVRFFSPLYTSPCYRVCVCIYTSPPTHPTHTSTPNGKTRRAPHGPRSISGSDHTQRKAFLFVAWGVSFFGSAKPLDPPLRLCKGGGSIKGPRATHSASRIRSQISGPPAVCSWPLTRWAAGGCGLLRRRRPGGWLADRGGERNRDAHSHPQTDTAPPHTRHTKAPRPPEAWDTHTRAYPPVPPCCAGGRGGRGRRRLTVPQRD